ncbi:MAG: LTA synthase family protein [Clostridia bacterium]|nr:LTA synthase family protein [Clostridia bacterium]
MIWIGAIAIGVLISVADIFLLQKEKSKKTCITVILRDTLMIVLTSMFLLNHAFKFENIFDIASRRISYSWKFLGLVLAVGVLYWLILAFIKNILRFEQSTEPQKKGTLAIKIISAILFALGLAAFTGTNWGGQAFGTLAADQIIINLTSPTEGTDIGVYISLFQGPVLTTALFTVVFCAIVFPKWQLTYENNDKRVTLISNSIVKIISTIVALALFISGCYYGIDKFQLVTLFNGYVIDSPYIEENFVDPDSANITFPEEKRNLIFFYLESMENTYFSKEFGGYFEENLMPDLAELSKEGIVFSHTENTFGGPVPTTGSGWSVSAMVNMSAGIPMKVPAKPNAYGAPDNFLPGATTVGDILHEQGYEQSVMFGADAAFGGLNFFYDSHGDFNILDHKGVIEKGWLSEHYNVWWGYEDDKLYEFAKTELTRLASLDKPFHFVMETADTHAPNGYLSDNAEKKFDNQYANCIYYSQAEAVKFIRWIQQQDFYENTTIIIIGDHLSMADSFFTNVNNYRRTMYNLFLNVPENLQNIPTEYKFNRTWAPFDMFPTTLASIGVTFNGNRLALGTNMFSGEKTLLETDGFSKVNEELSNRSKFYNENILIANTSK